MKAILVYLRTYFHETDRRVLLIVSFFTGALIFLNYHFKIDDAISQDGDEFFYRSAIFLLAFGIPYMVYNLFGRRHYFSIPGFVVLLVAAPMLFAMKMVLNPVVEFSGNYDVNRYWNLVFYWPALLVIMVLFLLSLWRLFDRQQPFYGLTSKNMNFGPYLLMLLLMVPLVGMASTQPDFLAMYPKLKMVDAGTVDFPIAWWHRLLFELSYGSDFFTIELFFRGFLVLAFMKWAGREAILPMACFYCTIHFGKPLGECISSYFGGLLLGIVVFNTRSILGGLMVHLGIAWMMEAGGYLGNLAR